MLDLQVLDLNVLFGNFRRQLRREFFHALLQFLVGTAQRLLSLGALGDLRLQRTGHEVEGLGTPLERRCWDGNPAN